MNGSNISESEINASLLREGRKFDFSAYLSSQFFGNYDQEDINTLMQAGNMLFFQPTERDRRTVANLIDPNDPKVWINILNHLPIGQAVLKGNFMIQNSGRYISTWPIICKIQ